MSKIDQIIEEVATSFGGYHAPQSFSVDQIAEGVRGVLRQHLPPTMVRLPTGMKYDAAKNRWELLPFAACDHMVGVLTFGAAKYAPNNWRRMENYEDRYIGAALRHLREYQLSRTGGDGTQATASPCDKETGLSHLAHAMCCIAFCLELDCDGKALTEEEIGRLIETGKRLKAEHAAKAAGQSGT